MKRTILYTLIFISGIIVGYYFNILKISTLTTTPTIQKEGVTKPLGTVFILKTSKGKLYILKTENYIAFEPFEHITNPYKSFSITKEEYPQLFKQGIAELSFITAEVFEDNESMVLIKISNNQPDHGVYSPVYELIVNPITGKTEKIQ